MFLRMLDQWIDKNSNVDAAYTCAMAPFSFAEDEFPGFVEYEYADAYFGVHFGVSTKYEAGIWWKRLRDSRLHCSGVPARHRYPMFTA